jgi:hypothetical protein
MNPEAQQAAAGMPQLHVLLCNLLFTTDYSGDLETTSPVHFRQLALHTHVLPTATDLGPDL